MEAETEEVEEARQRATKGITRVVHPLLTLQVEGPMKLKPRRKHTTYPWWHILHNGPGILGPPPQLNGVEFFKRRRVDAVTLTWIEKFRPLWKPKTKNK